MTIFALHHAGGNGAAFERVAELVGPRARLHAVDLPGRGTLRRVPAADLGSDDWSGSTIEYHRSQIRAHLGFRVASINHQEKLTAWLAANVAHADADDDGTQGSDSVRGLIKTMPGTWAWSR